MLKEIAPRPINERPQCLLVGNGINRSFNDPSWEDMIKNELKYSETDVSYETIQQMPSTMQIVVATADHVDQRMKVFSDNLMKLNMTAERIAFLRSIMNLPVDDILTANYSFELEAADGMPLKKKTYSSRLSSTFELEEKRFRLYQYYETEQRKRIWHIHGDVAKPETILMGHYYYAKLLRYIQECVPRTVRRYQYCKKNDEPFHPYSWVDQFLTGDIYIVGLGMYLCEIDLWYLLCCKKRNFPETKVRFYELELKDTSIRLLSETYQVEIVDGKQLSVTSFDDFYPAAFNHIRNCVENIREKEQDEGVCI